MIGDRAARSGERRAAKQQRGTGSVVQRAVPCSEKCRYGFSARQRVQL